MKLRPIHNDIRYAFMKINYSIESRGVIWSLLTSLRPSIRIEEFNTAFDELVKYGYIGSKTLHWCRIKPRKF